MSTPEIFQTIDNYPNYEISNKGRAFSKMRLVKNMFDTDTLRQRKELKQTLSADGYPQVKLYNDDSKQTFAIHQLVKRTFDRLPEQNEQVHHIDENKLNNQLENLEYISIQEHTSLHKKWS